MTVLALSGDFLTIAMAVAAIGVRHGFDADHLAAIDGMTYHNAEERPALAGACGALFSLGHGMVVIGVAIALSLLASTWQPPHWLATVAAATSIAVLVSLGAANLVAAFRTPRGELTRLMGWRSSAFARLLHAGHPVSVMAVGTLFALSFDTLSLAVLFAVTSTQFTGWPSALALALLFTFGMLVCDGVNGYWMSRLIVRSQRKARVASRTMAVAVAAISLATAALAVATLLMPAAVTWAEGNELWFGSAIFALLGLGFVVGQRLA
jgi:high-affinity nickel-transport protein